MMNLRCTLLIGLAPALVLGACLSAPVPPAQEAPTLPDRFSADTETLTEASSDLQSWWARFEDPDLSALIEKALTHNTQLGVAKANVETAQALLSARRLDGTPSTLATTSAELSRPPREGAEVELAGDAQITASWEYDAFGRIAAQIESAALTVEAAREARRDIAVIVAAETAQAYTDLRGNQIRRSVAQSNAALQQDSLTLLETLFENGRATRLDLERARSQYRTTLASLPVFDANIKTAQARLVTLTGQTGLADAPLVERAVAEPGDIPLPPQLLSVGTPDALIRRRPDIRAAEADIASRLALGQAERARLFPTLTFNANVLALFGDASPFGEGLGLGIGPALRWEGPDLRRVRADIDVADAQTKAAFARYENTVISALGEVEIALVAYQTELTRRDDLNAAAASAERAVELARLRFEEGVDDFLDVIDAQRTLLDAQDRLEASKLASTKLAIDAYRAIGGIWTDDQLDTPEQTGEL